MKHRNLLSATFFAPKLEEVFNLSSKVLEKDVLCFKNPSWLYDKPEDLAGALVMVYYPDYCSYDYGWHRGKMNMRSLIQTCKQVSGFLRMNQIVTNPSSYGLNKFFTNTHIKDDDSVA